MNKLLGAFVALFFVITAAAQSHEEITKQAIQVNVIGPASFDELLMPGASAKPLEVYSPYAADRMSTFNFSMAKVGNMKECLYSVTCDKGKVTGIYFGVKDAASSQELKAFVDKHLGQPEREDVHKVNGREESIQCTYMVNGRKAELKIEVDKSAYLTMK